MFQPLLEERFGLTWRREPKEMQVFSLVVGRWAEKKAQPGPGQPAIGDGNGWEAQIAGTLWGKRVLGYGVCAIGELVEAGGRYFALHGQAFGGRHATAN